VTCVRRVVLPLLLIAAAVAHASPTPEPDGYWTGDVNAPTPSTLRGAKVVDAAQVSGLLKRGAAVIVDVSNAPRRPDSLAPGAPWMPTAHTGIPGALWIPGAGLGVVPVTVDHFFRAQLVAATGGDFSRPVVVYCHQRCWLSWNAAKRAIGYGYRNVAWFPEGIEGWRAHGLSTAELKPAEPPAASPNAAPLSPRATPVSPHPSPSRSAPSSPRASPSSPDDDDDSSETTELATLLARTVPRRSAC
jgi:PQQ-dependent catabolism-associated CXXCW motif protein